MNDVAGISALVAQSHDRPAAKACASCTRVDIGVHYAKVSPWRVFVGLPFVYLPILVMPFILLGGGLSASFRPPGAPAGTGYLEYFFPGTIALDQCSRAVAWLDGRNFVTPDDVRSVAHDTLRHRIITSFEAEAQGVNADKLIDRILAAVPTP